MDPLSISLHRFLSHAASIDALSDLICCFGSGLASISISRCIDRCSFRLDLLLRLCKHQFLFRAASIDARSSLICCFGFGKHQFLFRVASIVAHSGLICCFGFGLASRNIKEKFCRCLFTHQIKAEASR